MRRKHEIWKKRALFFVFREMRLIVSQSERRFIRRLEGNVLKKCIVITAEAAVIEKSC